MRHDLAMDPDRRRTYIGIALIALVALAIVTLPRGGDFRAVVDISLQCLFVAVIAISAARLYRSRSGWLAELPNRDRGVFYGGIAGGILAIAARGRFAELGGSGTLLWLFTLGVCALAVIWVIAESRRYLV